MGFVFPVVVDEFGESFVQRGERVGVVVLRLPLKDALPDPEGPKLLEVEVRDPPVKFILPVVSPDFFAILEFRVLLDIGDLAEKGVVANDDAISLAKDDVHFDEISPLKRGLEALDGVF